MGLIPSRVIPKTLKIVLFGFVLSSKKVELGIRTGQPGVSMTWWNIMICVWGVIFQ